MNIPSSTAESGIGPVFYLVTAPAEFSDIEVGIGFDGDDGDEGNDWDHTRSRPKEVSSGDKSIEPSALVVIETHNIFGEQFVSIELDTARPAPEIGAEMGRRPAHGRYGPEQRPVVIPLDGTGVRDNMVVGNFRCMFLSSLALFQRFKFRLQHSFSVVRGPFPQAITAIPDRHTC